MFREATKEVQNIALDTNFAIPGDPGFPLNQVCFPFLPLSFSFCIHVSIEILSICINVADFLGIDVRTASRSSRGRDFTTISSAGTAGVGESVVGEDI